MVESVDLTRQAGLHPHVGALDVMPVVYLDEERRGAACAEALTAAGLIGDELGVPVFLYGELATDPAHAERADLRRGGPGALAERMERGELRPDFGPARAHPRPARCWPPPGPRWWPSTWTWPPTTWSWPGRWPRTSARAGRRACPACGRSG